MSSCVSSTPDAKAAPPKPLSVLLCDQATGLANVHGLRTILELGRDKLTGRTWLLSVAADAAQGEFETFVAQVQQISRVRKIEELLARSLFCRPFEIREHVVSI